MNFRYYKYVVVISVIAIVAIAASAWFIDRYSVDGPEGVVPGVFWIRSDPPIALPCPSELAPAGLEPRDSMLIAVQLSLMNESSSVVLINANESTIEAVTKGGRSIRPVDPMNIDPSVSTRLSGELDMAYQSGLWGKIDVEPNSHVDGFVIFETGCDEEIAILHIRSHGQHTIRYRKVSAISDLRARQAVS